MAESGPDTLPSPPRRSALKTDDDDGKSHHAGGPLKAVQIAEPAAEPPLEDVALPIRRSRTGHVRRLSGKSPFFHHTAPSSRSSLVDAFQSSSRPDDTASQPGPQPQGLSRGQYLSEKLLLQVEDWLNRERIKEADRKHKPRRRKSKSPPEELRRPRLEHARDSSDALARPRTASVDSQSSDVSLDRLQRILETTRLSFGLSTPLQQPHHSFRSRRRATSRASLHRTASSDTDYVDGDAIVPACDVWLDNSKTLGHPGGGLPLDDPMLPPSSPLSTAKAEKEREAWLEFKNEIVRIAHTLRLKGWRRVPLGSGDSVKVERLSGALTNAVYVLTPPANIAETNASKKRPSKVLLRVYGPQVEHLIDRDNELQVLRRLARQKIGPRLLGTFRNGRFEQFFNAITLTPANLREPDTSRQIAKRMRELHEGIELLPHEREGGPGVWRNWDQWLDSVAKIITHLDEQLESNPPAAGRRRNSVIHAWKLNGYVCGVPWPHFRDMVAKYRAYVDSFYPDQKAVRDRLVFAHNDTQYGNILRIQPDDEKSPLLRSANQHKQLVVIDFEYAAANTPGFEFANHFTEWTYNYHDPIASHACNCDLYPTPEEQRRFIKAYVDHRPQFPTACGSSPEGADSSEASTPSLLTAASSSSIVDFMLDARVPPGGWGAAERAREEQSEGQVRELLEETRLWRPANSAQWVAWGIVQAKVPSLSAADMSETEADDSDSDSADEFDYLSYAQDRALFFWADCLQMGLVRPGELPDSLRARLKTVEY